MVFLTRACLKSRLGRGLRKRSAIVKHPSPRTVYYPREIVGQRNPTTYQLLAIELKTNTSLKAVKEISFAFDPFHPGVGSLRRFLSIPYQPSVKQSNTKCKLSTQVLANNIEPEIRVTFVDQSKYIFKTENLSCYEILKKFNAIRNTKIVDEDVE